MIVTADPPEGDTWWCGEPPETEPPVDSRTSLAATVTTTVARPPERRGIVGSHALEEAEQACAGTETLTEGLCADAVAVAT